VETFKRLSRNRQTSRDISSSERAWIFCDQKSAKVNVCCSI